MEGTQLAYGLGLQDEVEEGIWVTIEKGKGKSLGQKLSFMF